jgi:hypothetical protein
MIIKVSQQVQNAAEVTSTPATYLASAGSIVAGLTLDEWQAVGVIGGLILGTLTFATNFYFKCKHDKRLSKEYKREKE